MSHKESEAITQDPFWSAFHRRHPDVDIVLLPDAPPFPQQQSSMRTGGDPEGFLRSQSAAVEALWGRFVEEPATHSEVQWTPGVAPDTLRCSLTLTLDAVEQSEGLRRLHGALQLLPTEGWHVFAPPTGLPRVIADRPGAAGDEEVLVGYAPETERLFLRFRSAGLSVEAEQARALTGKNV